MLPEEVLDAPEATGRDGAFLGVGREFFGHGGVGIGLEAHAGRGGEGPQEAGKEGRHVGGRHDRRGEEEGEEGGNGEESAARREVNGD